MTWKQHLPENRRTAATLADFCVSAILPVIPGRCTRIEPGMTVDQVALRRGRFAVLAVLDEVIDHGGISQGRGVAEARRLVLGDLAQDSAHDLARARFG